MKLSTTNNPPPPLFRVCYYITELKRWDIFSTPDIDTFESMIDILRGLGRTFRSESYRGMKCAILDPSSSSLLHSFSNRLTDRTSGPK